MNKKENDLSLTYMMEDKREREKVKENQERKKRNDLYMPLVSKHTGYKLGWSC